MVDFAIIFAFSALVAFITDVGAAVVGRERPRLVWPFGFSSLVAILTLLSAPAPSEIGFWLFTIGMVVMWPAALGTVIGALLARLAIKTALRIK
jgi:hypothetical protein